MYGSLKLVSSLAGIFAMTVNMYTTTETSSDKGDYITRNYCPQRPNDINNCCIIASACRMHSSSYRNLHICLITHINILALFTQILYLYMLLCISNYECYIYFNYDLWRPSRDRRKKGRYVLSLHLHIKILDI